MERFLRWLKSLFGFGNAKTEPLPEPTPPPKSSSEGETEPLLEPMPPAKSSGGDQPEPSPQPMPPTKSIVTLLIYPTVTDDVEFDKATQLDSDKYYLSSPWEVSADKVNDAIRVAEDWLADTLTTRIRWNQVRLINSQRTVSQWRSGGIGLLKDEVDILGLPWTDDYIYLAFVRGMGGFAGGVRYDSGNPGYAMVGDICLEAICSYPFPTAGSVLLGDNGWPSNSFSLTGQTGAFIHEALHGLDLPHPDGWPEGNRPDWDDTLMGHWWNMPNFPHTRGLTQREIERGLKWSPGPE